jgi:hypothetical protein
VATDEGPQPLRVSLVCPSGLVAGTDVRVTISSFHSFTHRWRLDDPYVDGDTGVVVLGHGLPRDWTDMIRGGDGPAGGGLVGRPVNELYLCTVQVTRSLAPGECLVFPFGAACSPHADIEGSLQVRLRRPREAVFEPVGEPIRLRNAPGAPSRLEARLSAIRGDGRRRLVVFATDDQLNPIPDLSGAVHLRSEDVGGLPSTVALGDDGRAIVEGLETPMTTTRIEVREPQRGLTARSGPACPATASRGHYFGAIHFHTRLSVDGDREPPTPTPATTSTSTSSP